MVTPPTPPETMDTNPQGMNNENAAGTCRSAAVQLGDQALVVTTREFSLNWGLVYLALIKHHTHVGMAGLIRMAGTIRCQWC